jgi:ABC-type phosphate transport system substrate-binding protein
MRNSRRLSILVASLVAAAALSVSGMGTALGDPPSGVIPKATDIVAVGSGTTQYLFDQLSHDYNNQHKKGVHFYSWDATNPATGKSGGLIVTKAGCPAISRPDDSSAGITALEANITDPSDPSAYCIDFAQSYRAREPTDPPYAPGGIVFVDLASDAVTYATRDAASGGTNAPGDLTSGQLTAIYECKTTDWDQVGGKNAPIHPFLPQTDSDTRAFFLTALGGGTTPIIPGPCVSDAGNTLEENEGVNPVLNDADAIFPYSVAAYLAQAYHSAACLRAGCTGSPACKPSGTQNLFGCDQHGVLGLDEVNGTAPVTPWPLPKSCSQCHINPGFAPLLLHEIYTVVRYDPQTATHIPAYLGFLIGASSDFCSNARALSDVAHYGFYTDCGAPHVRRPASGTSRSA